MAVVEAQVAALELERVIPKVRVLFERDDKFFANIKKRDVEKISHRQMRVPLELRPGGSFQYFNPDGGDLGRGGGPTFDKAVLNCVFLSENIEYTKLTQWATDDARKAIVNSVRRLTATALDELRRQLDAQMMQAGDGVIGTVTTDVPAGGSNVITLTTDGFGARLMRYGQTVQVFDTTLAINRGSGVITFWDVENKVINITPQIALVAPTDKIVTNGISSPASLPALFGVPYHHSNASAGTWLGFSRSTTPEIRANIRNKGIEFLEKLNKLKDELGGLITKVQGTGLLFSCELDPGFKCSGLGSTEEFMREHGIGVIHGGVNSLRFTPHFNITSTEIDLMVEHVRIALLNGPRKALDKAEAA